jgi:18S rRNA (adenine1779-N6/adenine1780-N6)-dimethyltransferase
VPIDPPPPIKFEEFDGLNRIIFSRPNKTIRGNFQAKGVMKMLEQNRSTWLSLQNKVRFIYRPPIARNLTETNGMFFCIGRHQSIDDDRSISTIVDNLLEELGHTESRAAKMDIDDLLK